MPYPKRPYIATHIATHASGFWHDLIPYPDATCVHQTTQEKTYITSRERSSNPQCGEKKTWLHAGSPTCAKHLPPVCEHGRVACMSCKIIPEPPVIHRLHTKRVAREWGAYIHSHDLHLEKNRPKTRKSSIA